MEEAGGCVVEGLDGLAAIATPNECFNVPFHLGPIVMAAHRLNRTLTTPVARGTWLMSLADVCGAERVYQRNIQAVMIKVPEVINLREPGTRRG
jgi:hypothetical protein